jgi:EAL domain-containing protein (putative c-di-GMP-specific phosphodiesterase class I)/CheY-like chemotaxis protein
MRIAELNFLVVEDQAFQRAMLLRVLAGLGATAVTAAADGREALEIIAAQDPAVDVVVSDLDMPDMDGMEFMRHLGELRTPVAVVLASALETSVLASVDTMARAYGVEVLGVIEKPVTPANLAAILDRYQARRPAAVRAEDVTPTSTVEEIVAGLEGGEFEPFFQPKVDLGSGQVTGAEALARWRRKRDGKLVPPSMFIELVERHDLIDRLTWIMLRESAAFCRAWRASSGLDVTISVNLSIKSLANPQIAEQITELVRAAGVEPRHMVLELTESAAMTNIGQALENLSRLRMKGFGLSIDDYGTGYSSMLQLTRIAFTELKIDQSFVLNAVRQKSARVILESSLEMARRLGIASVAEGVETRQDWDLLRRLGCQVAQGYFIARPMAAEDLMGWCTPPGLV